MQRGAVPPLIAMLGQSDVQLKEMGAFALGRLAQNSDNQAGIVQVWITPQWPLITFSPLWPSHQKSEFMLQPIILLSCASTFLHSVILKRLRGGVGPGDLQASRAAL